MKKVHVKGIVVLFVFISIFTIFPGIQHKEIKANTSVYGKEIDTDATVSIPLTAMNETGHTSPEKNPDRDREKLYSKIRYNKDGSVSFTSNRKFNSGISYYLNPCEKKEDLLISPAGRLYYPNATRDILDFDYIRLVVNTKSKIVCRTYSGEQSVEEDDVLFEGADGMFTEDVSMDQLSYGPADIEENVYTVTNYLKDESYTTRTLYLPIRQLINKNVDVTKINTIAISSANINEDVRVYSVDLIKLKIAKKVQEIKVYAAKHELKNMSSMKLSYMLTPYGATRQQVRWSSSDEELATVNFNGQVKAGKTKQGIVTITASAVDGSGSYGSITLSIVADQIPTMTPISTPSTIKEAVKNKTIEKKEKNKSSTSSIEKKKLKQPRFLVKKKRSGRIKYLLLSLKKYEGTYLQVYVKKGKGKFTKIKLKKEKIKTYKNKIKIQYLVSRQTLYIKVRTYKKKSKSKIYSSYSKVVKIKV